MLAFNSRDIGVAYEVHDDMKALGYNSDSQILWDSLVVYTNEYNHFDEKRFVDLIRTLSWECTKEVHLLYRSEFDKVFRRICPFDMASSDPFCNADGFFFDETVPSREGPA